MKKPGIFLSFLVLTMMAYAQKKEPQVKVPQAVKAAFQKLYPTAKEVEWEMEDNQYEAEFELKEVEQSALFDANGRFLESEKEIPLKELPADVMAYMKANYANQKIKEACKITDASGVETYEVEVKEKDLLFTAEGKFLKEEKKETNDTD